MTVSSNTHTVATWISPQVVSIGITGLLVIASFVGVGVHSITHLDGKIDEVSKDLNGKIALLDGKIDRFRQELSGQIQHINTRIDFLITQPSRQGNTAEPQVQPTVGFYSPVTSSFLQSQRSSQRDSAAFPYGN